jgi:hypothetical protein
MHGSFSVNEFRRLYDVSILTASDVDPRLREHSYGYGVTKMISFWHSPFERFLHIDADAVCWGNVLDGVPWQQYDLIYNEPHEIITPYIQRTQYFDPAKITPPFEWESKQFFNTGIFSAKRGILDIQEYLGYLAHERRAPGSFSCGDQGILNLMAFHRIAEGRIRARSWPFQAVVPVIAVDELRARFRFRSGRPVVTQNDQRLIHWAGPKPLLWHQPAFSEPMTYYRLRHWQLAKSVRFLFGKLGLLGEEMHARFTARHRGNYAAAAYCKIRWIIGRLYKNCSLQRVPRSPP